MAGTQRRSPAKKAATPKKATQTKGTQWAEWFKTLSDKYGNLPADAVQLAYAKAAPFSALFTNDPYVQNRRVKHISSLPEDHTKDEHVQMLQRPDEHDSPLRQVSNILEYTAYPMYKIRQTYQDLLTYRHYVYPVIDSEKDAKDEMFRREWRTVVSFEDEMQCARTMRQIVGQCIRDGKVFYTPRVAVDKSHARVDYAYLQQLPQDWVKIAGFNNLSKYTIAFNMFYFLQPGTTYKQFGDLFEPYIDDFLEAFDNKPKVTPRGVILASKNEVSANRMMRLQELSRNGDLEGTPEIYNVNGTRWFYWVYLPAEKVWTFEADDVKPNVISPLSGLFLSMAAIAQYEQVQLEIVQNPLVALLHGEIETYDAVSPTESDPYKVSPPARELFESLFYKTMAMTNTGGIGIYSAPFKNMKLDQLSEAPNANEISASGYEYAMEKSGLSALIPTTSDARAGVAQISLMIESRFAQHMYWQFERMMNVLIAGQNFHYQWKFKMFGSLAEDQAMLEQMIKSMELGILPDVFAYNGLRGRNVLDDIGMSYAITASKLLEQRLPLVTSYSARNSDGVLPPFTENEGGDEGGRPRTKGITSDGKEADQDDARPFWEQ